VNVTSIRCLHGPLHRRSIAAIALTGFLRTRVQVVDRSFAVGSTDNITAMLVVFPGADRFNTPLDAPKRRWTFGRAVKKPGWVSALFGAFGGGGGYSSDGEGGDGASKDSSPRVLPDKGKWPVSSAADALAAARAAAAAEAPAADDGSSSVANEEESGEMVGSILQVI